MFYGIISSVFTIIGVLAILISIKVLLRSGWIGGFLRGMSGCLLIGLAIMLALSAWDIYSYDQIVEETSIATISFEQLNNQRFSAVIVDSRGNENKYQLAGDQWQMDARLIKWPTAMAAIGVKPGYRLERISGRYYSLEEERTAERTVFDLHERTLGIDIWRLLHDNFSNGFVDAVYGSATFVPMADKALYEIKLSNTGLIARPLNEPARAAVNQWQ